MKCLDRLCVSSKVSGVAIVWLLSRDGSCTRSVRRSNLLLRVQSSGLVYGRLPPDSRRGQAAWFNDSHEHDEQRALVATDAIGMGLNLNIKRVIFTTLEKYDGRRRRRLTPAEIKQIAGRAGRYGTEHAYGQVTCLHDDDMQYLQEALASPPEPLTRAGLAPTSEQLRQYVSLRAPSSWVSPVVSFDIDDDDNDNDNDNEESAAAKRQDEDDIDFDEEDDVFEKVMATDPAAYDWVRRSGGRSVDDKSGGFVYNYEVHHDHDSDDDTETDCDDWWFGETNGSVGPVVNLEWK